MQIEPAFGIAIEILLGIIAAVIVIFINRRSPRSRRYTWSTRGRNTNVDINS